MTPLVVGIDLSLVATGVANINGTTATLDPAPRRGMDRIIWLRNEVANITTHCAHLVVIEDYAFSRATHAHELGELGGVVKAELVDVGTAYVLVNPSLLKTYALGKGGGKGTDKVAMGVAAFKRSGLEFPDDNQCDAAWLRWMGLDALGAPEFEMPATHRQALSKIEWPDVGWKPDAAEASA